MNTSSSIRSLLALVFLACGGTVVESSGNGGSSSGSTPSGVNGGGASPARSEWSCVNGMQSTVSTQRTVTYHLVRQNAAPIADVQVKVCDLLDLNCTSPIEELVSDADGNFTVSFSQPVVLALTAPPPYLPAFIQTSADPAAPAQQTASFHLATSVELEITASNVGTNLDKKLGTVLGLALSCQGKGVSGVSFSASALDTKSKRYFLDENGTPSTTQTTTSSFGSFGFINVPPGFITLEASVSALAKKVALHNIRVKAGAVTYVEVWPNL